MVDHDSFSDPDREFSEEPDLSITKSNEQKKRERIRDNQRRSRARRQEHLADLEKRLSDCHSTLREAELQQAAYRDAQIENARLRDLLRIAGVNEAFTQEYVKRGVRQQDVSQAQGQMPSQWGVALPSHLPSSALQPREGRNSFDARDDSSRASPFSDVSSMSMSMSMPSSAAMAGGSSRQQLEPPRLIPSSQLPVSPTILSPSYSPSPQQQQLPSQMLPMEPHMLLAGHVQNLSIYQPVSPQPHHHHPTQQQHMVVAGGFDSEELSPERHPTYKY